MKDNLEAKFYDNILKAAKTELPTLEKIEFLIDNNIDNPSNTNIIDCAKFFKDSSKKTKTVSTKSKV